MNTLVGSTRFAHWSRLMVFVIVGSIVLSAGAYLSGCSSKDQQDPTKLESVQWRLVQADAENDLVAAGISIAFDGTQTSGNSGVNTYFGPYSANDEGFLSFGDLAMTEMAGPEELMNAEQEYHALLSEVTSFIIADGKLELYKDDKLALTFEEVSASDLTGAAWEATGINTGDAVSSPLTDTKPTLKFDSQGRFSSNATVNNVSGTYTLKGDSIQFNDVAATLMAGEEPLMEQEQSYLKALEQVTNFRLNGVALTLTDAEGITMLVFTR